MDNFMVRYAGPQRPIANETPEKPAVNPEIYDAGVMRYAGPQRPMPDIKHDLSKDTLEKAKPAADELPKADPQDQIMIRYAGPQR